MCIRDSFPNPTDTLTLIPFLQSFSNRYDRMAHTLVADSGDGSEENYRFMSENGMEAYVKYNYFHMEQRPESATTVWAIRSYLFEKDCRKGIRVSVSVGFGKSAKMCIRDRWREAGGS